MNELGFGKQGLEEQELELELEKEVGGLGGMVRAVKEVVKVHVREGVYCLRQQHTGMMRDKFFVFG